MTSDSSRPRSGLTLDQAFERWSDAATYQLWQSHRDAGQPVSVAQDSPPNERVRRHQVYAQAFEALQARLRKLLLDGEVLASGIEKGDDGRSIIKPSLWQALELDELCEFGDVVGGGHTFEAPEFFAWSEIPQNVEEHPHWLTTLISQRTREAPPVFRHDPGYQRVWLDGQLFQLGDLQAEVVRLLHAATQTPDAWCNGKDLLEKAGSSSTNIAMLFKHKRNWKHLIESDGRGRYRLGSHGPDE